jgi:hypothetical protein
MSDTTPLLLDLDQPFSLGQLVLASAIPSAMIYKATLDGKPGQMLKFEGTWTLQSRGSTDAWIKNHAHFSLYIKKGPGVWVLSNHHELSVPMTKEELTTMYRFFKPNRHH